MKGDNQDKLKVLKANRQASSNWHGEEYWPIQFGEENYPLAKFSEAHALSLL
jgi:hypothetical protein